MVGQRARRWSDLDVTGEGLLLRPAGSALYLAVVLLAGALMLGSTGWVLAGGPPALAQPLFLLGMLLSVSQLVWAGRRRPRTS
ncbi:hypothetical protein [Pseudokineococcus sp. 1T1Z-3]|uniref:hypothetical protein n=1 Tax=Pseudokineococcus sp. 1T1Z-3 TaxID=3132745 RepID=UPI0030AFAC6F